VYEVMTVSPAIREMILDKRPTSEIKRAARDSGMTFLRQCAVDLVLAGTSTLREINKVTFVE
jgi:type IV pilus assembly protein PilB